MLTSVQCRAARAITGLSVRDLATKANVSASTVTRFENGRVVPIAATLEVMRRALEAAGAEFIPGGARLREQPAEAQAS